MNWEGAEAGQGQDEENGGLWFAVKWLLPEEVFGSTSQLGIVLNLRHPNIQEYGYHFWIPEGINGLQMGGYWNGVSTDCSITIADYRRSGTEPPELRSKDDEMFRRYGYKLGLMRIWKQTQVSLLQASQLMDNCKTANLFLEDWLFMDAASIAKPHWSMLRANPIDPIR